VGDQRRVGSCNLFPMVKNRPATPGCEMGERERIHSIDLCPNSSRFSTGVDTASRVAAPAAHFEELFEQGGGWSSGDGDARVGRVRDVFYGAVVGAFLLSWVNEIREIK
jgi:hypothetical protein